MVKILELFGGIGSPRVALRNLGVPTKAIDYVEIDQQAVNSYNAMFADELPYKTQTVVDWNLKPDILIHGSPCQDWSIAGKRLGADEGSGTRSSLMWETVNIIRGFGEWKPKYVLWENVLGVLHKTMNHNFNKYLDAMQELGYNSTFAVLNARDFGLPQNRNRVFTISTLGQNFNFDSLRKTEMKRIEHYLETDVDESYTITSPSMLSKLHGKDNSAFAGRLKVIEDYCWTITTKQNRCPNSGVIDIGNGNYRLLTPLECWRLQGYDDEDYLAAASVNKKTALYKQAGNSIPVPIFESIFEQL